MGRLVTSEQEQGQRDKVIALFDEPLWKQEEKIIDQDPEPSPIDVICVRDQGMGHDPADRVARVILHASIGARSR